MQSANTAGCHTIENEFGVYIPILSKKIVMTKFLTMTIEKNVDPTEIRTADLLITGATCCHCATEVYHTAL